MDSSQPSEMDDDELSANLSTIELKSQLRRAKREIRSVETYNRELRDQVDLMSAKMHLAKKFLYQSVASQTDIHIPPNEMNSRVFASCIMLPDGCDSQTDVGDDSSNRDQQKIKFDLDSLLRDMKSSGSSDYTYDPASKTYYSRSTGWYYYPVSVAKFNIDFL